MENSRDHSPDLQENPGQAASAPSKTHRKSKAYS